MSDLPTSQAPTRGAAGDAKTRVLLAMLHAARDRGDRDEARRLWLLILVAELERARGLVRTYGHHTLPGGRIPAADVDDVVQSVFLRLHDKIDGLKGRSVGELRKFMTTATGFACLDYVDRHVREDRHRGASLDTASSDNGTGAGGPSPADRALADLAEQLAADGEAAELARGVVHPALALIDANKRAVLVLDQQGYSVPEIMERLELSRDNVYQLRKRGLKQLASAIRELAEEDEEL